MREIKFRAWNIQKKEMYYATPNRGYIMSNGSWWALYKGDDVEVASAVHRDKLMQYTGLKDKNGVEIYEGDIVQWSVDADQAGEEPLSDTYTVIYRNGGFYLENHKDIYPKYEPISEVVRFCGEYQVLGNIYENKELLDEQD